MYSAAKVQKLSILLKLFYLFAYLSLFLSFFCLLLLNFYIRKTTSPLIFSLSFQNNSLTLHFPSPTRVVSLTFFTYLIYLYNFSIFKIFYVSSFK